MAKRARAERAFTVLVASDGSKPARAAVATAAGLCWPARARIVAVAARELGLDLGGPTGDELEALAREAAAQALRALGRRRARASAALVEAPIGPAVVAEARRRRASVIVVGSRGRGPLRRMLLGSTSRYLVREAGCPVLVVRERPARGARVVLGVDGSPEARRAVAFLAALEPAKGARVQLVSVVEPLRLPSLGTLPAGVRATLRAEATALAEERHRSAERTAATAARRLERAGWDTRVDVLEGVPLDALLERVASTRADLLALGARGVGGVRRWLLGSVAEGALAHAPCAVLVVR